MEDINKLKETLIKQKEELFLVYQNNMKPNVPIYETDFIFIGATNKALANISAFLNLIETENYLIALAIIRLQLDVLLRFFAILILDKKSKSQYMHTFLKGERIDKLQIWIKNKKDKNVKQNLTDAFLCQHYEKIHKIDWITRVYKQTSKFIHMSGMAFHSITNGAKDVDKHYKFSIGIHKDGKIKIEKEYLLEALACFADINRHIIYNLNQWESMKYEALK